MTQPQSPISGDPSNDRVDPYITPSNGPAVSDSRSTDPIATPATTGTRTASSGTPGAASTGTKDVAAQEASEVKDTALQAGQQVAGTAKEQAHSVAAEAGQQTKQLWQQTVTELGGQASTQQQRLAGTLASFSQELGSMASSSTESGVITDLAHEGSRRGGEIAHWLESREPKDVLEDVKSFARRRPVTFLALAATAGVLTGRLTRGLAANAKADHQPTTTSPAAQLDQGNRQDQAAPAGAARENISLQDVPTSGTGSGPSFYAPDVDAVPDHGVFADPSGRPEGRGGVL